MVGAVPAAARTAAPRTRRLAGQRAAALTRRDGAVRELADLADHGDAEQGFVSLTA
jgi:hypothetical protein